VERRQAAIELGIVASAVALAWAFSRFWLYPALSVPSHAPVILRPITGFLTAWVLLRRRGLGFDAVGFTAPSSVLRALLATACLYGVQTLLSDYFSPWLASVIQAEPTLPFIGYVRGNLVAFLGWLALGWVVGGFMEELLFRGFLQRRATELVGDGPWAHASGVVFQAVCFGALHLYGGAFAFVHATVFALASGLVFLVAGRNLWPLILVHGLWNSLGIYGVYAS
jgi:membrane protease YdiL (CAAX protease family)